MRACVQVVSNAGAYTQACDVWSIGVITYMLLSGTPPFKGDTDSAVLQAVRLSKYVAHGCRYRVYWLAILKQLYLVSPVCSPRYRTPPPPLRCEFTVSLASLQCYVLVSFYHLTPSPWVCCCRYSLEGPRWEHVSHAAKDFISKTLVRKPRYDHCACILIASSHTS